MTLSRLFGARLGLALVTAAALRAAAGEPAALDAHLAPLRPLLGKTWKGAFTSSKPDQPTVDVQRWERVLNGKAIRVLHSINDVLYGGETIFSWDERQQAVVYYYFTTAGFMTTGKLSREGDKIITREEVTGDPDGVTEVRATSELLPDGKFHVKAEYRKHGAWAPGHEVTYQEDASAAVVFK